MAKHWDTRIDIRSYITQILNLHPIFGRLRKATAAKRTPKGKGLNHKNYAYTLALEELWKER